MNFADQFMQFDSFCFAMVSLWVSCCCAHQDTVSRTMVSPVAITCNNTPSYAGEPKVTRLLHPHFFLRRVIGLPNLDLFRFFMGTQQYGVHMSFPESQSSLFSVLPVRIPRVKPVHSYTTGMYSCRVTKSATVSGGNG